MSEQEKDKAGLHKEISSIFQGVPIPQTDGGQEPSGTPAPERSCTEPKPPTPEPQKPCDAPVPERTDYTKPKQPALTPDFGDLSRVEPQKPNAPKPCQAMQSLPESIGARQPKADIDDIEKNVSQKPATVKISSQTFRQQITNKLFTPKPGVSATRQKAMVVMMPLLFIVLIFMFRGVFGTGVRKTEAFAEDNTSSVTTADDLNTEIDWEIPATYPTTLRDPMRLGPAATAQTETKTLVKLIIKGILYTEDNPSVVIGDQIVHEGEEIRGVTVLKISKDSVEFEMNGRRWTQKVR